jgi:hypothetical protein
MNCCVEKTTTIVAAYIYLMSAPEGNSFVFQQPKYFNIYKYKLSSRVYTAAIFILSA